jgi:thiamine transporter ThiT
MQLDSNFEKAMVVLVIAWLIVAFFWPPVGAIVAGLAFGLVALLQMLGWAMTKLRRAP